jgi:acetone carboxylase gamma subunit
MCWKDTEQEFMSTLFCAGKASDWRSSKQYTCPDCGNIRGIGFLPKCPHGTPPVVKGVFVTTREEDAEFINRGRFWQKKTSH